MATVTAPPPTHVPEKKKGVRANYTRAQALGLVLIAAGPALMLTIGAIAGMDLSEDIGFFGTLIVVPLITAGLVWRFGTWAKIVGILVALGAAAMMFWTVFGLAYPGSPADFVPGILVPGGVLLTIGCGIASIVAKRRGHLSASKGESLLLRGALIVVALAAVISAGLWFVGGSSVEATGDEIPVVMHDFAFDEDTYRLDADEPTALHITNDDGLVHTFTVPELDIHEVVHPGSSTIVETVAPAGTYTLYCEPHSNMDEADPAEAGMAASLVAE